MFPLRRTVFGLLATTGLVGCGPSAAQLRTQELERQLEALRVQLHRQDERVTSLANEWVMLRSASRPHAEPAARVPESLAVVRLAPERPAQDDAEVQLDEGDLVELSADESGERLRVVKVAPLPPAAAKSAPSPSRAAPEATVKDDPVAEREFSAALAAFREGKVKDAMLLFQTFLTRHPKSQSVDDARYWMGECQFELKSYVNAIAEYGRLTKDHPRSNKVAESLLKIGISYERLGDERRARESFASLVQRFPESAVAELARARVGGAARSEVRP